MLAPGSEAQANDDAKLASDSGDQTYGEKLAPGFRAQVHGDGRLVSLSRIHI